MSRKVRVVLMLFLVPIMVGRTQTQAGEPVKPVFYAPMEGAAVAEIAAGSPQPIRAEGITFVEGKDGKGVLLDERDVLAYATKGNLDLKSGSILMWVKLTEPLESRPGWDRFFDMTFGEGNTNALRILTTKDDPEGKLYSAINAEGTGHGIGPRPPSWRPGEWHHIALTWGPQGVNLMLDGDISGYNPDYVAPAGLSDVFVIGNTEEGQFSAKAVIDEVYIFDVALFMNRVREIAGLPSYIDTDAPNLLRNSSFEVGYFGWTFWWNADLGTRWQIVETDSPHGRRALLVDRTNSQGPGAHVFVILGEWMPLEVGMKFTFSAYLKSDKPGTRVGLKIQNGTKQHLLEKGTVTPQGVHKAVDVGTSWQRVSVTGELPPAYKGAYRVSLSVATSGCKLWVDGLQFATGDLRDYVPGAPIEMGYNSDRFGALYNVEETVAMRIYVYNDGEQPRGVTLRSALSDAYDQRIASKQTTTLIPGRTVWSDVIEAQPHKRGQYDLRLVLSEEGGKELQRGILSFCAVKSHLGKPSPGGSSFGVTCGTQNMELKMTRFRQVGIKHLRPGVGLAWPAVEPTKGAFHWDWSDRFAHEYGRKGLEVLPVLGSTPPWARRKTDAELHWRQGRILPASLDDWGKYVRQVVSRYKDNIKEWEIWNEPNGKSFFDGTPQEYAELLKVAYKACKQADPKCKVFGCSTAGLREKVFEWLEEVFAAGALNYMDGVSVHPYRHLELPEKRLADDVRQLVALMEKYGGEKDIYYTEFGWPGTEDKRGFIPWFSGRTNEPSERHQAQMLVRSWVISLAEGVDKLYWYQWHGERWSCGPDLTALIRPDCFYTPKKAVVAFNAMIEKLENATYLHLVKMQAEGQYGYEFETPAGRVAVLWSKEGQSRFKFDSLPKGMALYDIWGNRVTMRSGEKELTLTEDPIYIESSLGISK